MTFLTRNQITCAGLIFALQITAGLGAAQERVRTMTAPRNHFPDLVVLRGNTRPEAIPANDLGPVNGNFPLTHMWLELRRPPEKERALVEYIDQLHDPNSANFRHWLTADEFGQRFGLSEREILTVTGWLQSQHFQVNLVYPNRLFVDFSGTAGQVQGAFHTEIHRLNVHGKAHYANMSDPRIPSSLSSLISGIVSLHDFRPRPLNRPRPEFTIGGSIYEVVPADLATIYNIAPLFANGYSGQGQTIVVVENTDVFSAADWTTFRTTLGLSAAYPFGTFTQTHPPSSGTNNCSDPGVISGFPPEAEAILDAEWSSAAAPNAAIQLASCADTTTPGIFIALLNILNASNSPPAIVSISYGSAEVANGASGNSAISSIYQQAVTEGVSVFVASGDQGAAVNDYGATFAANGINVSGFASTPYNVAVGGTDFGDTYAGTNSTYWNATNSSTYGSAKSYVPEIPWNDSCGSVLLSTSVSGSGTTFGSSGFCNNSFGAPYVRVAGGSGGPSSCASGVPTNINAVSGTCAGVAKPAWQSVFGNPGDGVRDVPDVSLFAADGVWNHSYVICMSDASNGGASCSGTPDTWSNVGGTSVASPIMAGIQALINQAAGSRMGNPNPTYYSLASTEYGASGDASCNSTLGNTVSSSCIFYDVTQGDIDQPCQGVNCYRPSGTNGVLSTAGQTLTGAYATALGSGYSSNPNCSITGGGGSSATCTATLTTVVSSVNLGVGGSGYTSAPACAITGGGGTGATCTATISSGAVNGVFINTFGSGYTSTPTCGLTGGGGTSATCTAVTSANQVAVSLGAAGSGYTVLPDCTLTGGGGTGATCTAVASNSASANQPAFSAATGWDFATGIGTVNAYNLAAAMSNGMAGLSPHAVSFGPQAIGTSSATSSPNLSNTGLATLTINSITLSGGNAGDFQLSQSCLATLAPAVGCPLQITFKPTAVGPRKTTISVSDSYGGSPQSFILTGVGIAASLSPPSLTFASQTVNTSSSSQTVTLTNVGASTMNIWEIGILGTNAGDFSKTTICSGTLGAGLNCTVSVTFKPTATGARSAVLMFSDNGGGSPQSVALSGTGM